MKKLNGWKRLWIALTVISIVVIGIGKGFTDASSGNLSKWQFYYAAAREAERPECERYMNAPLNSLSAPDYDHYGFKGCGHIYVHRNVQHLDLEPFNLEKYRIETVRSTWETIGEHVLVNSIIVIICSVIAYSAGLTIAWIRRGFNKTS